ncbi:hypothetical protein L9F63_012880, partial [Diploptera punctata]
IFKIFRKVIIGKNRNAQTLPHQHRSKTHEHTNHIMRSIDTQNSLLIVQNEISVEPVFIRAPTQPSFGLTEVVTKKKNPRFHPYKLLLPEG